MANATFGKIKHHRKRVTLEIITQMLTLATNGFGLVAALAWNSVIQEAITTYIKPYIGNGSGLISLSIYAVIVTVLAVVITYQLSIIKEKLS